MKSLLERISANADELRQERAKLAVGSAVAASTSRLLSTKQNVLKKLSKVEHLLDLGATSTTDIGTHLHEFDAEKWANQLYGEGGLFDLVNEVTNLNARIKIHNMLFPLNTIEELNGASSEIIQAML